MTQGTVLCVSFPWLFFLFPGGPKPSRAVFSAGKLADFTGKQGENSASWATQRTVPCSHVFPRKAFPLRERCPRRGRMRWRPDKQLCRSNAARDDPPPHPSSGFRETPESTFPSEKAMGRCRRRYRPGSPGGRLFAPQTGRLIRLGADIPIKGTGEPPLRVGGAGGPRRDGERERLRAVPTACGGTAGAGRPESGPIPERAGGSRRGSRRWPVGRIPRSFPRRRC